MKKLVCILLALALCLGIASAEEAAGFLGKPFPDFTAEDTQGNAFTLAEALKEHEAVLLNLWATWCPPCRAEMPYLEEAFRQYGDRVAFIALSCEENDTREVIEAFRQENGLTFPMGRDEGQALSAYIGSDGIPVTVIIDRFGNAAFFHVGCFLSAGEVSRVLDAFLGEAYAQTAVLGEIPPDTATLAFPVSAKRDIIIENENVQAVTIWAEGISEPQPAYVIHDDTARLRLEISAKDNPGAIVYYNLNGIRELSSLLDADRGAFTCEQPLPGPGQETHYVYACLIDAYAEDDQDAVGIYLLPDEQYIEELADEMRAWGYQVRWEFAEPEQREAALPEAYILHIIDQDGAPVGGVTVNFCTDAACSMLVSDGSGTVVFRGEPDVYHVQILKAPEGYGFDAGFELYTGRDYGEWTLRIRKN